MSIFLLSYKYIGSPSYVSEWPIME